MKIRNYVIDINNIQECYAACLDYIRFREGKEIDIRSSGDVNTINENIRANLNISFGYTENKFAAKYFEVPMEGINNTQFVFKKLPKESYFDTLKGDINRYHIRIHLATNSTDYSNYINFQYLAILLRFFDNWGLISGKRISIFVVPEKGCQYPYDNSTIENTDTDTYGRLSQFIYLLAKRYKSVIYGAYYDNKDKKISINTAEFRNINVSAFEQYLPLLIIDKDLYASLFDNNLDSDKIAEIISGKKKRTSKGREKAREIQAAEIPLIVHNTIHSRIKRINMTSEIKERFLSAIEDKRNASLMQLVVFSFMVGEDEFADSNLIEEKVNNTWYAAAEVNNGIRQIVQNSIQHTSSQESYFTLYLKNNGKLSILLTDINEENDILTNFKDNLKKESLYLKNKKGHESIIKTNPLKLRNLFMEFQEKDDRGIWRSFREQDYAGHIGLSLFAMAVKKCSGSIAVQSCSRSLISPELIYSHANDNTAFSFTPKNKHILPGTEVYIEIPVNIAVKNQLNGFGRISNTNTAYEDYSSLANYLLFKEIKGTFIPNPKYEKNDIKREVTNRDLKRGYINLWNKIWASKINGDISSLNDKGETTEKVILRYSLNAISDSPLFNSNDAYEVSIKGLLQYLGESEFINKCYIAITDVPLEFVEIFREVAGIFSIRKFPENVQLCITDKNTKQLLIMLGDNYLQAISNALILSYGNGFESFSEKEYLQSKDLFLSMTGLKDDILNDQRGLPACPFDVLLTVPDQNTYIEVEDKKTEIVEDTLFEKNIRKTIESDIDRGEGGCKINPTHTRLSSNIHIQSFYEVSYLFYRTMIANRIAFLILRKLSKDKEIDILKDIVLFYGYVSYSKAILTSLREILCEYRKMSVSASNERESFEKKIGFVSYQHNLHSKSKKMQMYFGIFEDFPGSVDEKNNLVIDEDITESVKVIQIIPISTTLSTFHTMWKSFSDAIDKDSKKSVCLYRNYTVLWVTDERKDYSQDGQLSLTEHEKKFVNSYDPNLRTAELKVSPSYESQSTTVHYYIDVESKWHDPLTCKLCFPNNPLMEIPLIETDATSTVPAQQIRYQSGHHNKPTKSPNFDVEINNRRILNLKDYISYGHIIRRQNHYQFYIDTQSYFYKTDVKEDVKEWLEGLREKDEIKEQMPGIPIMKVIISPEHNTNVGFAQYVNNYYFKGMAEVVSFNIDKQFRSNFFCEHKSLADLIDRLNNSFSKGYPVRFYFVDDTIITGETFQKSNSFLHSLLKQTLSERTNANLFNKVFLLEDRISDTSKKSYVAKVEDNFYSYVHIDVSNVRTQGDSCIGCKLKSDMVRLKKRSAINRLASIWLTSEKKYGPVQYDDLKEMEEFKQPKSKAAERLFMTHVMQNVLINERREYDFGVTYEIILELCEYVLGITSGKNVSYNNYISILQVFSGYKAVGTILKILSRPFLSFDFNIKTPALTFIIALTEHMLSGKSINKLLVEKDSMERADYPWKDFLYNGGLVNRTQMVAKRINQQLGTPENKIDFVDKYLFESLADLKSTYLLRKSTLENTIIFSQQFKKQKGISDRLSRFWESFSGYIQRITETGNDISRKLRIEYLYLTQEEPPFLASDKFEEHIAGLSTADIKMSALKVSSTIGSSSFINDLLICFRNEVFIQNTSIHYEYMKEMWNEFQEEFPEFSFESVFKIWDERKKSSYDDKGGWEGLIQSIIDACSGGMSTGGSREIRKNDICKTFKEDNVYLFDNWKKMRLLDAKAISLKGWDKAFRGEVGLFLLLSVNKQKSVNEWYNKFLEVLGELISEKYEVKKEELNLALLTWDRKTNQNFNEAQVSDLDYISDRYMPFNRNSSAIPDVRYSVKERVINALQKKLPSNESKLLIQGYDLSERSEAKDNGPQHIIVSFKNELPRKNLKIQSNRDGKEFSPMADVFLYISITKPEAENIEMYQRLILRDILTYRHKILGFLQKNFIGDIYTRYAHETGEKNVLSHEKVSSHMTTTDDEASINLILNRYVFQEDLKDCKNDITYEKINYFSLSKESTKDWIMLRNYTNNQIAKLFIRTFISIKENLIDKFPLYPVQKDCIGSRVFKYRANYMYDLGLTVQNGMPEDERFQHLRNVMDFKFPDDNSIGKWEFINVGDHRYNLEYLKCILTDICFSAMKYQLSAPNFLERIDYIGRGLKRPIIVFTRENSPYDGIDYLVIKNPVSSEREEFDDWEQYNEKIRRRLCDPLDYADGHMSLITIKRYIEQIFDEKSKNNKRPECEFFYAENPAFNFDTWFFVKLPILKKGEDVK